jgi:hypothetical protein
MTDRGADSQSKRLVLSNKITREDQQKQIPTVIPGLNTTKRVADVWHENDVTSEGS